MLSPATLSETELNGDGYGGNMQFIHLLKNPMIIASAEIIYCTPKVKANIRMHLIRELFEGGVEGRTVRRLLTYSEFGYSGLYFFLLVFSEMLYWIAERSK